MKGILGTRGIVPRAAAVAAACAAALCVPAAASASAINVAAPGASGNDGICNPCKTIQGAITIAAGRVGGDTIYIPAGTYAETLSADASNAVFLVGAGAGVTTIADPNTGDGLPALTLSNGSATGIAFTGSGASVVTLKGGTLAKSKVTSGGSGAAIALTLELTDGNATVSESTITAPMNGGTPDSAVEVTSGPHTLLVTHSTLSGDRGLVVGDGIGYSVKRSKLSGYTAAAADHSVSTTTALFEDSVLWVRGSGGAALDVDNGALLGTITLDGVTMYSQPGATGTHGVAVASSDGDVRTVTVRGSIFAGFSSGSDTYTSYVQGVGSSSLHVNVGTTRFDPLVSHGFSGDNIAPTISGVMITADPMFKNAPAGDFRLRLGSPMVDKGPYSTSLPPARGALDLRGAPRLADGNHDNMKRTDMGAYEFQGGPVQLSPVGVPVKVLGSMRVRSLATCNEGAWIYLEGNTKTYNWYRGKRRIAGQHKRRYRIRAGDFKRTLRCQVVFTSTDTVTASKKSAGRVVVGRFATTQTPINGT